MIPLISGLYLITDRKISGIDHEDMAVMALKGGVRTIQLREKEMTENELLRVALKLRGETRRWSARLIINDNVHIARDSDADGVHLGQEDLPIEAARKILGSAKIIGVSTHNINEAVEAQSRGADYIGLGPIFQTETKNTQPPLGTELIREVKRKVSIPVVAIGGINLDNLLEVIEAGADAVAVISSIVGSGDITETVRRFIEEIEVRALRAASLPDTGQG
ncbi:MAG: thiamine phosphate synthase [Nitrospirae bacterium]|nr:thiamine phosphate synthase [Nitrospirota bacterium]